ncbi:hypothetical protein [Pantoea dispersa]|uniref:hypothetical protein n=1 Tax=Pantoea dispersa TaxID=59814 RepID=UPI0039B421AA
MTITTEFKPDAASPNITDFVNITPESGWCTNPNFTSRCRADNYFSLLTNITATQRVLDHASNDNRQHTYQRVNGEWRTIKLVDRATRREIEVQFRLFLVAYRFNSSSSNLPIPNFNAAGIDPLGGCEGGGAVGHSSQLPRYAFAWIHPAQVSTCYKKVLNMQHYDLNVDDVSIAYAIKSVSPMTLPNGNFTGSVTYSVGQGKDIDLGDAVYDDDKLTFNIQSIIQHQLEVKHLGSNKLELKPKKGWDEWSTSGDTQARLEAEANMTIVASSAVSVSAQCDNQILNYCALKKDDEDVYVGVNMALTVPGMYDRETGEAINDKFMPMYAVNTPGMIMVPHNPINTVSTIKFWVDEISSMRMLQYPGSTWRTTVTLLFDADIFLPTSASN